MSLWSQRPQSTTETDPAQTPARDRVGEARGPPGGQGLVGEDTRPLDLRLKAVFPDSGVEAGDCHSRAWRAADEQGMAAQDL